MAEPQRHLDAVQHLARCAEAVVAQAVAEMSARRFEAWVLVQQEDVVALREALRLLRAVWQMEEEEHGGTVTHAAQRRAGLVPGVRGRSSVGGAA